MKPELNYLQTPFKTFLFAISKVRGRFLALCIFATLGESLAASLPYFFKRIANQVAENPHHISLHDLMGSFLLVLGVFISQEICFRTGHILETYIAPDIFKHITASLYERLMKRPTSYFEDKFSGELGRRIEQIGLGILYFVEDFPWRTSWVITSFVISGVLLGLTNVFVFLIFVVWFILFLGTSLPLLVWYQHTAEKVAAFQAHLSGGIIDTLTNIPIVHSFGGTAFEQTLNQKLLDTWGIHDRKSRWVFVVNRFQQGLSVLFLGTSLTFASIYLFSQGKFTVGDFVVVAAIIPSLINVIWNAGDSVLRASKEYGQLADAVIHLRERQEQLVGGVLDATAHNSSSVAFKDLFFQYPATEHPVFKNFSLRIEPGEHVGIVGPSGVGKSTLIKLLLRHYEPGDGEILIGDTPIKKLTIEAFNKLISYVPQDTSLFHRTLFDNIHYADSAASTDAVLEASRRAHADEFIKELPEKYDTKVGERGVKLSGGQRQRIALARAILKNAPILILDEATSSLDSESESVVQQALTDLFESRTVIAIAHRLSTLRAMDRIIVMENGSIIENGTPHDLLQDEKSIFKKMWEHQKNGFI